MVNGNAPASLFVPPVRPALEHAIAAGYRFSAVAPFRVVNIGNSEKVSRLGFIEATGARQGKKANRNHLAMQMVDVMANPAKASIPCNLTHYQPRTDICDGIVVFADRSRKYYVKQTDLEDRS